MSIHHKKERILYYMKWPAERFAHENKTKNKKKNKITKVIVGWGVVRRNFWRFSFKCRPFRIFMYSHDVFDGFGILVELKTYRGVHIHRDTDRLERTREGMNFIGAHTRRWTIERLRLI